MILLPQRFSATIKSLLVTAMLAGCAPVANEAMLRQLPPEEEIPAWQLAYLSNPRLPMKKPSEFEDFSYQDVPMKQNRQVVFLGDSLAQGYALGFKIAVRKQEIPLITIDEGKQSSGLVRHDFFDWPSYLGNNLPKNQDDCLVFHFGANDDKPIPGLSARLRSPDWSRTYEKRVRDIIQIVQEKGFYCVLWLGPAPDKDADRDQHLRFVEKIYQRVMRDNGVDYLPLRGRYGDQEGNFQYDIIENNIPIRIRSKDGSHFNIRGYKDVGDVILKRLKQKSFYVQRAGGLMRG
ncbi:MAG: DUF459 domain-containing protein [Alphaproteobacteria bacterium]